ncbi:hypothetical protein SD70_08350 [Gordoniibacillus kamchatkensis]|uniref:Copper amine oxidase-like N-terminal domain-containing protein n=1 Tax=Gordoniibacillus kamchatkensis TaxID=1590651 RepID=A0ABR5AKF2_9BACL|nr:stalk domain-containing protein [Paenibacillus sp. VKM B-2647]KIL41253.1 hypothetical protein SD70_08350 [Paenibacillus sp. VKM B-2647]
MGLRWKRTVCAALFSASLALMSGCQAVGGVDLGKALEQQMSLTSAEANETISIEFIPGQGAYHSQEDEAIARLFDKAQLKNVHMLMQDASHISVEGEFVSSSVSIPFQVNADGDNLIIQLAGAKKPIVIGDVRRPAFPSTAGFFRDQLQQHTDKVRQLQSVLTRFFVRNAPNPAHASVSQVTDSVHGGGTMSMDKVELEIKGSELKGLLQSFLKAIAADDDGLKELIGQVYDIVVPLLKESLKQHNALSEEDSSDLDEVSQLQMAYLDNKTLAVEFAYTTLKQGLNKAIANLDKADAAGAPADVKRLLSDELSLKIDWLLDSKLNLRKQHIEFNLPTGDAKTDPIAAVRIVTDSETWNHNQPVTVKPAPDTKDALELGRFGGADKRALLANFDPKSDMYRILKDDLHITRERIYLIFSGNDHYAHDSTHPYIDDSGTAMVSVRFLAERLGAKVKWDADTQSVHVTDEQSGTDIVILSAARMRR